MHEVTCIARDLAGNEARCTFMIEVVRGEAAFIRGDANADGSVDIGDSIRIFNFVFLGGVAPACLDAADCNDDGRTDIADGVQGLNYNFFGASPAPPPFLPTCGLDPSADELGCGRYRPCE
jgi:hypothetical protein